MAVIRIRHSVNVRNIWIHNILCSECHNSFTVRMKGAQTRKNCPYCNEVTFWFNITPMSGYLEILAEYEGHRFEREPYEISSEEVEIVEE